MNRRTKKAILACVVGVLMIMQIAAKNNTEALVQVANQIEDPVLRDKILAFQNGDVERQVEVSAYDSEAIINYAENLLGTPHRMGGSSVSGLDCSGMVMLVHAKFGIDLPHGSEEQAKYGRIIPSGEELQKGDLVFFHSTYNTPRLVTHSGIYVGDGKFIHTSTSRGVMISEVHDSKYWGKHFLFATRLY